MWSTADGYCTTETLRRFESESVPIVLVSEGPDAKRRILSDFGHALTVPNNKNQSKLQLEMRDLALMMSAIGIIQHTPSAWSSYSSVVAMARRIPLFSTWRGSQNRLDSFAAAGGTPKELTSCDPADPDAAIEKFLQSISSRLQQN